MLVLEEIVAERRYAIALGFNLLFIHKFEVVSAFSSGGTSYDSLGLQSQVLQAMYPRVAERRHV